MLCEKGMTIVEARNALLIAQSIKHAITIKTQSSAGKTNKHYTIM